MFVVLIGPPGCGKGTQSKRLTTRLGVPHLSTGEMLRAARRHKTPLGARVAECIDQGRLVSDELIMELVEERLGEPECAAGCLFDGVPRTIVQAEALDEILARQGTAIEHVFELRVGEQELLQRMLGRAAIEKRPDDTEETIRRRMEIYAKETKPLSDYYLQAGKLRVVNGQGTPDEVFSDLAAYLKT